MAHRDVDGVLLLIKNALDMQVEQLPKDLGSSEHRAAQADLETRQEEAVIEAGLAVVTLLLYRFDDAVSAIEEIAAQGRDKFNAEDGA